MKISRIRPINIILPILLIVLLFCFLVFDVKEINAKASDEKALLLLKDEFVYDLTKVIVVRKNSKKPEIIKLENVEQSQGYISSETLKDKSASNSKNRDRYEKLKDKIIELSNDKNIEHVQPDYLYSHELWSRDGELDTPDDFDLTPSPSTGKHWYYEKSNLRSLWKEQDCYNSGVNCGGNENVVVAVIDTGLAFEDFTSVWPDVGATPFDFDPAPEIVGGDSINLWTNSDETPGNNIDDDNNGYIDDYHGVNTENYIYCLYSSCNAQQRAETGHPNDDGGHGTYVTGLIASSVGNASGSVSPAQKVSIMPIKANYQKYPSFGTLELIEAIDYARENGADIINMSLAGPSSDYLLEQAINTAYNASVLIVAASGNNGGGVYYPAKYPNVVAVGAVKADNTKTGYSAYGPELDLVAYVGDGGSEGNATYQQSYTCFFIHEDNCYTSQDTSRYKQFSNQYAIGTSFASPQVAAAAAIILGNNLTMGPDELRLALAISTNDIYTEGRDDQTAMGVLDYMKAGSYTLNSNQKEFFSEYIVQDPTRLSWLITANPSSTEDLYYFNKIGGQDFGPYLLKPNERKSYRYMDLVPNNKGPAETISSANSYTTQVSKIGNSYYQVHGVDLASLTTEYFYPEYIVNSTRKSWILVGNPSETLTNVMIDVGGEQRGPFEIPAGGRISKLFTDLGTANRGPVKVTAESNIYSSQINSIFETYNQIQGIKLTDLTTEYFYPEYIVGRGRNSWLLVGNPSELLTASVTFDIGGEIRGPYLLQPGENISKIFYDLQPGNRGPVKIFADQNIYSSQISSINEAFYQMVGLEVNSLKNKYFYPEYIVDDFGRSSWIIFSNPSLTESITINIKIGGITKSPLILSPGENSSQIYLDLGTVNKGPVEVSSVHDFYTVQINKINSSFYVVPGM